MVTREGGYVAPLLYFLEESVATIIKKPKKRVKQCPEVVIETPALNLLDGKFMYKYSSRKLKKLEGYVARYAVKLKLKDDDSPIKRAELSLVNESRGGRETGKFAMPVVFWELLHEQLGEFLAEVHREMEAREESKIRYKLKRLRGSRNG